MPASVATLVPIGCRLRSGRVGVVGMGRSGYFDGSKVSSGILPGIVPQGIVGAGTGAGSSEHARDHVAGCMRTVVAGMPVTGEGPRGRGWTSVFSPAVAAGAVVRAMAVAIAAVLAGSPAGAAGFLPSEQVLPATTRAWASAPDASALRERFDRSALGRLFDEPLMQAFYDSLDEQRSSIAGDRMGFGITPKELAGISGGESAVAAIEQADGTLGGVLMVDTTGHDDAVPATLETVFKRLADRGAKQLAAAEGITSFELPPIKPREGQPPAAEPAAPRRIAYAVRPGALVAGTNADVVAALLPTLAKGREDALDSLEAFREVARKCSETVPAGVATGRWFVDPLGFAQAQQKSRPAPKKASKRKPTDYVELARRNGFDCIKGAGGVVFFGEGDVDLRHNTLVYAPPTVAGGKERYEKAARILEFPNATSLSPAPWVPGDAASWLGLQWDLPKVFRALEPLVDDIVGEPGVFDDVISSLKEDPDGPQIDVENDLIRHLGSAVMVTGDHVTPFGPDCERMLIAIAANDPETVAATIARSMATEAKSRKIDFGGHLIWETVPDEPGKAASSTRVRAGDDEDDDRPRGALGGDADTAAFPNGAVAVAHGQILIASHLDILKRVLEGKAPPFAEEADYNEAVEQLKALLPGDVALRTFARTEQMVQPTYELLRGGLGPENKSLAGRFANAILAARDNPGTGLGGKKPKEPRKARVDGTTLPEFDKIRHYFGTAGMTMQTVPEGWMFVGASLWNGAGDTQAPAEPEAAVAEPVGAAGE